MCFIEVTSLTFLVFSHLRFIVYLSDLGFCLPDQTQEGGVASCVIYHLAVVFLGDVETKQIGAFKPLLPRLESKTRGKV